MKDDQIDMILFIVLVGISIAGVIVLSGIVAECIQALERLV